MEETTKQWEQTLYVIIKVMSLNIRQIKITY